MGRVRQHRDDPAPGRGRPVLTTSAPTRSWTHRASGSSSRLGPQDLSGSASAASRLRHAVELARSSGAGGAGTARPSAVRRRRGARSRAPARSARSVVRLTSTSPRKPWGLVDATDLEQAAIATASDPRSISRGTRCRPRRRRLTAAARDDGADRAGDAAPLADDPAHVAVADGDVQRGAPPTLARPRSRRRRDRPRPACTR